MDQERIAEILESLKGSVTIKAWRKVTGSQPTSKKILAWLDSIGVTGGARRGKRRELLVSLDKALQMIRANEFNDPKVRGGWHGSPRSAFKVVFDPTSLFKPGAIFPAHQIWGQSGNAPPTKGELPTGIILYYGRLLHGQFSVTRKYIFDGTSLKLTCF